MAKSIKSKQVMVSYRIDGFTSKISLQPALVEALDIVLENEGNELNGKQWCSKKAAFAKANGVKKVSAYVREMAFRKVLPREIMSSHSIDLKTHDISYRIERSGQSTTLTIGAALLHYLNRITNNSASIYLGKLATTFHNAKSNEDRDISHCVREAIIQDVMAEQFA
ncbi:hypothetical protein [Vibrio crassostreae]|uniref:hypothetical protein n=1 Tax=Vibrio crassostreae TaxID=246167 RepID=UPI001B31558F|nr:hypothetical protein [Vibrio crassostreae]